MTTYCTASPSRSTRQHTDTPRSGRLCSWPRTHCRRDTECSVGLWNLQTSPVDVSHDKCVHCDMQQHSN